MILLKVDPEGVAILKFESYAPGPSDVDRVSRRNKSQKCMKIEAHNIHVFRGERLLKQVQAVEYSFVKATINFVVLAVIPKFGEAFVSESSYGH